MNVYVQCFVLVPFMVVMYQFYSWIVSLEGSERQSHCRWLGVTYTTLGTVCFTFRSLPLAVVGMILFALGLRLIAYGLDRQNKTVFIDQFDEDRQPSGQTEAPAKAAQATMQQPEVTPVGDATTVDMRFAANAPASEG